MTGTPDMFKIRAILDGAIQMCTGRCKSDIFTSLSINQYTGFAAKTKRLTGMKLFFRYVSRCIAGLVYPQA